MAIRYLLINSPLTDPTAPYHSISYLVAAAVSAGFEDFLCIDANVEALNHLSRKDHVLTLLAFCDDVRRRLEGKGPLTRGEQLQYRYALKGVGMRPIAISEAIAILKDPERFYDYEVYRQAVLVLTRWLDLLSVQGFPGQFTGFYVNSSGIVNLQRLYDLTDRKTLDRFTQPLAPYFHEAFAPKATTFKPDLVGISVNYVSQLPFAIWLCEEVRRILPECVLCVGGTEVSDVYKYIKHKPWIWNLFRACDAVVVGEGESAFVELLRATGSNGPLPESQPGVLINPAGRRHTSSHSRSETVAKYEFVATLPAPRYDVWDWKQYWSPEPVILYSPTRGCYWNKCTFCDYGLNTETPTSPSREKPVGDVIDDIAAARAIGRVFYFAVDAMSPAYLRKLSKALSDAHSKIYWAAELRLERSFRAELASELRASGCVAVSFGYESGCQRILDLIRKGVRVAEVPAMLQQLAAAGVAVQMMGFIGFPGETVDEALETFRFLDQMRDFWAIAGVGDFVLTPGAIVAKRPGDFGIEMASSYRGEEIARHMYWIDGDGRIRRPGDQRTEHIDKLARRIARVLILNDRPFVGGIDSTHSLLYYSKFGSKLLQERRAYRQPASRLLNTISYSCPLSGVDSFISMADIYEHHAAARSKGESVGVTEFESWLAETPSASASDSSRTILEILPNGQFIAKSHSEAEQEQAFSSAFHSVKHLLLAQYGLA